MPPLNLVGDFGGGGMLLAFGLVCGILEARASGKGQVVDAAMIDGSATLMAMFFTFLNIGKFSMRRGTNLLDSGAHFYDVYETKDGQYVSVGAIEPQFYEELLKKVGSEPQHFADQLNPSKWPEYKKELSKIFKTRTRDEWCALMEGSDACFAPVLSIVEAPKHPHNQYRGTFVTIDGVIQPAPAPRFSRTIPGIRRREKPVGQDGLAALSDYGFTGNEIDNLLDKKIVTICS